MGGRFDEVLQRAERFIQSCEPWGAEEAWPPEHPPNAPILSPPSEVGRLDQNTFTGEHNSTAWGFATAASAGGAGDAHPSLFDDGAVGGNGCSSAKAAHFVEEVSHKSAFGVDPSPLPTGPCYLERIPAHRSPSTEGVGKFAAGGGASGSFDAAAAAAAGPSARSFAAGLTVGQGAAASSTAASPTTMHMQATGGSVPSGSATGWKGATSGGAFGLDGSGLLSHFALASGKNSAEVAVLLDGLERENMLLRKQLDRTFDRERTVRSEADRLSAELTAWKRSSEEVRETAANSAAAEIEELRDELRRQSHLAETYQLRVEAMTSELNAREASATDLAKRLATSDSERLQAARDLEIARQSLRVREAEVRELQLLSKYFVGHRAAPTPQELGAAELAEEMRQRCAKLSTQVDQLRTERDLLKAEHEMARLELRQSQRGESPHKTAGGRTLPSQNPTRGLHHRAAYATSLGPDLAGASAQQTQRFLEHIRSAV
mmetsp:Transcript_74419/g.177314  ORF Transcript_74419/g.177314 Transcript_74419/m.177314 type:complete len:490 (+) Transcript_74419:50-1519(+)